MRFVNHFLARMFRFFERLLNWPTLLFQRMQHALTWHLGNLVISPLRWLTWPFRTMGYAIREMTTLIFAWWSHRDSHYLIRGLPTVLLLVVCLFFLAISKSKTELELARDYRTAGYRELDLNHPNAARLYLERMLALDLQDLDAKYKLAEAANALGDTARRDIILDQLAPLDHPVYAEAHLNLAQTLLEGVQTIEQLDQAEKHLKSVLQLTPTENQLRQAKQILGGIYYVRGKYRDAIPYLSDALSVESPPLHLYLMHAKCLAIIGEEGKSHEQLERARKILSALVAKKPQDVDSRLLWADTENMLNEFPKALQILQEGRVLKDEPILKQAMARTYVYWSLKTDAKSPENRFKRFEYLSEAARLDPNNPGWYDGLQEILIGDNETTKKVHTFLIENIAAGRAIGMSHLLLGTAAFTKKDEAQADYHLTRAFETLPEAAVVINNLAWFMVYRANPNPKLALELIEPLIAKAPRNPRFRDTRGHILVKLERWKEAIADLEFALPLLKDNPDTHRALAEAYSNLGDNETAAAHLKLAEELQKTKK